MAISGTLPLTGDRCSVFLIGTPEHGLWIFALNRGPSGDVPFLIHTHGPCALLIIIYIGSCSCFEDTHSHMPKPTKMPTGTGRLMLGMRICPT